MSDLKYKSKYLLLKNQQGEQIVDYLTIFYNSNDLNVTVTNNNESKEFIELLNKTNNLYDNNLTSTIKIPSIKKILQTIPNSYYINYKTNILKPSFLINDKSKFILNNFSRFYNIFNDKIKQKLDNEQKILFNKHTEDIIFKINIYQIKKKKNLFLI